MSAAVTPFLLDHTPQSQRCCWRPEHHAYVSVSVARAHGAGRGGFHACPPEWLAWNRRRHQLVKVIAERGGSDVVTLVEVDHFEDWYRPQLEALGYDSVYRADMHSPCLRVGLGEAPQADGVAVFWKRDKLQLDESVMANDKKTHKQKFIVLRLQTVDTGEFVVVGVAHFDSKKDAAGQGAAIRAEQSRGLLSLLRDVSTAEGKAPAAVLLAGDFNAPRDEGCYAAIVQSELGLRDAYDDAGYGDKYTSFKTRFGDYKPGTVKVRLARFVLSSAFCLMSEYAPPGRSKCHTTLHSKGWACRG